MASRRIYTSSNGDTWDLVREGGDVRVRHRPNAASGGSPTDHGLGSFLAGDHRTPQGEELVKLIGSLVEGAPDADRS